MSENIEIEKMPDTHGGIVLKLADAMLSWQIKLVLPALALGIIVSTVWQGLPGLWGALIGATLTVVSSLLTLWLMRLTAHQGPHLVMAAAMGGFIGKMIVILVVLTLLQGVDVLHPKALAFTMLAGVLVAAVADSIAFRRSKLPTIIPAKD